MSKVTTFSVFFPSYHPKKAQSTNFVEKIRRGLAILEGNTIDIKPEFGTKYTTIRAGNRWKVGDKFSPRIWSGKPYHSKQIIIAPDIEVKKVWKFEINWVDVFLNDKIIFDGHSQFFESNKILLKIAKNDGLSIKDFRDWFQYPKPFQGQVLCWNENIKY